VSEVKETNPDQEFNKECEAAHDFYSIEPMPEDLTNLPAKLPYRVLDIG
jgi:hypothetical protein